jgi:hypothetical protein
MRHHSRSIMAAVAIGIIGYSVGPEVARAPANAPNNSKVIPVSIVTLYENASTSPSVSIEYPQFPSLPASFNEVIASSTNSRLANFRQEVKDNSAARDATANNMPGEPGAALPMSSYSFIASWQLTQINGRYVSFIIRYDSFVGGANEDQELVTFNYDVLAHKIINLGDLFPKRTDYIKAIADIARSQLTESLNNTSNGNAPAAMISAGTEPTADNFADFTFTDYIVTIYFPKYAVAPGSFGEQHVDIPRSAVE